MIYKGENMLPDMIAKKIMSAQKDLIVAALKNNTDTEEVASLLCEHIPEEEGRFDIESELLENITALKRNQK